MDNFLVVVFEINRSRGTGRGLRECRKSGFLPIFWCAAWRHLIGRQAIVALRVWSGGFG